MKVLICYTAFCEDEEGRDFDLQGHAYTNMLVLTELRLEAAREQMKENLLTQKFNKRVARVNQLVFRSVTVLEDE